MSTPSTVRVVFTGHSGLAKASVLESLCQYISETQHGKSVRWYSAEKFLDMPTFLDADRAFQRKQLRDSLAQVIADWKKDQPDFAFLSLHLTYLQGTRIFSPWAWSFPRPQDSGRDRLEETLEYFIGEQFQPHYLVNLIDDIPFVQWRIGNGDKFHISLAQLYLWRNMESLVTDLFAKRVIPAAILADESDGFPFERSPQIAIRHPPSMLFRFVSDPTIPRVYASFPIGSTRSKSSHMEEFDRFRSALNAEFVVFDPLTIDELPLESLKETQPLLVDDPVDFAKLRWPMAGPKSDTNILKPITIDTHELEEVMRPPKEGWLNIINDQVEWRDLRLIEQSDCLIIYRPQFQGSKQDPRDDFSGGTRMERDYARMSGKPRFLVHDPAEDGSLSTRALRGRSGATYHLFNKVGNLSDPKNQAEVMRQVAVEVWKHRDKLIAPRMRNYSYAPNTNAH